MSQPILSTASLDPGPQAALKRLTRAPTIAWPTVIMWATLMAGFIGTDVLAVTGHIPLWLAAALNSVIGYLGFSVVHDSIHRSVSTNLRLNDWIGRAALLLIIPYATLEVFRLNHIQHHRFANGRRDPDQVFQGPWWQLPFRWMFIDGFYLLFLTLRGDRISRRYFLGAVRNTVICAVLLAALVAAGYGREVLMLWFIPSRLIMLSLGFSFFWLPHVPHDVAQEDNFTRATTVRLGYEPLMNVLLQYQNFHLIHHLYPSTPFYNNGRVWHLLEAELRQRDLAIQYGFAIRPTIHPASSPPAQETRVAGAIPGQETMRHA